MVTTEHFYTWWLNLWGELLTVPKIDSNILKSMSKTINLIQTRLWLHRPPVTASQAEPSRLQWTVPTDSVRAHLETIHVFNVGGSNALLWHKDSCTSGEKHACRYKKTQISYTFLIDYKKKCITSEGYLCQISDLITEWLCCFFFVLFYKSKSFFEMICHKLICKFYVSKVLEVSVLCISEYSRGSAFAGTCMKKSGIQHSENYESSLSKIHISFYCWHLELLSIGITLKLMLSITRTDDNCLFFQTEY